MKKDFDLFDLQTHDPVNEDFISLTTTQENLNLLEESVDDEVPIMILRNTVLFPGIIMPITIGRRKSLELIRTVEQTKTIIGIVAQVDANIDNPTPSDIFSVGTLADVLKILKMPDNTVTAIVQGKNRFRILSVVQEEPFYKARIETLDREINYKILDDINFQILITSIKETIQNIAQHDPEGRDQSVYTSIQKIDNPVFLLNVIASNLKISHVEKQKLLEIDDYEALATEILKYLEKDYQFILIKEKIHEKVKSDIDKQQRDYFLNVQLKAIQEELGGAPHEQEIQEIEKKAAQKKWDDRVKEAFEKELAKLRRMNPMAAEFSIQLNYLDFLVDLPWNEYTEDNFDIIHARKILDEDHFGLEKVKERIIEFLAVLKLKKELKSPILCLVGPPGVGKTSLGKSIARALGRKYVRMSLGGLRDEAELRGHRKTYIGAMPGRIIQGIRKAKSSNPLFVLDEIDKVAGMNVQGDPQAALLEILDPEQNTNFYDNYLEIEYDLSKVFFLATANTLTTIHPALRDRMEIIELSGYTQEEKVQIAMRHLVPKQLIENGMENSGLKFTPTVISRIICDYTRESGVRMLERNIAKIIRGYAARYVQGEKMGTIKVKDIPVFLGIPIFQKEKALKKPMVGLATGLAWTIYGGEILFIESSLSKGKGNITMTGNLGDVMKESVTLAYEYIKANAAELGISEDDFEKYNVHVHIPEGATPKDGPSAGITIFTSLVSLFKNIPVRTDVAMTGEITLRGKVLPVGGIKEKILAAKRAGIKHIILSSENRANVEEIEKHYLEGLIFHYVDEMYEVLPHVLVKK
ncbi:MAG: endopeptidase La [Bacteroidales bacterium]|nr:endopeptidase La [Bacteroidales bacterium]